MAEIVRKSSAGQAIKGACTAGARKAISYGGRKVLKWFTSLRSSSSHTGALASEDVLYETLFRQAGIIRANTIKELFEYMQVLSRYGNSKKTKAKSNESENKSTISDSHFEHLSKEFHLEVLESTNILPLSNTGIGYLAPINMTNNLNVAGNITTNNGYLGGRHVFNTGILADSNGNINLASSISGNILTCATVNGTFIEKTIVDAGLSQGNWFLLRNTGSTVGTSTNLIYVKDPNGNTLIQLHPSNEGASVITWALVVKMGVANTTWTLISSGH